MTGGPAAEPLSQSEDLPLDSHLHTTFSSDSNVALEVYAAQAAERRIAEIAITDHIDFDPGWPNYAPDVRERERAVREAAERWAPRGVTIRFGVEVSYESAREAEIRDHLARTPYDFTIGSIHIGPESPFHATRVAAWVDGRSLSDVIRPYFDEVERAIRSRLFDTIGHLDFVKRYLHPHVTVAQLADAPELYEPLLRALVETGTGLEVNTSGLRQAPAETYPAAPIVARYRELGGRAVTAGSDAHRADAFAFALEAGYRVAVGAGFRELTFRRGGERIGVAVPSRLAT